MISASALLVVVAFVTLIVGIFQSGLGLIWVSIASSVLAAVFLGLGVAGSKRPVTASGPGLEEAGVTTAVRERVRLEPAEEEAEAREHVRITPAEPEEAEEPIALEPAASRGRAKAPASRRRERARPTATRAGAARSKGRAAASKPSGLFVVIPDRDKFHKEECRYAKGPGAMTLTKAQARRQGYKPCGVCKP